MLKVKNPVIATSILLANVAIAGSMGASTVGTNHYVAELGLGAAWEGAGKTQTITLAPDIIKTYSAEKGSNALAIGELFLGMQHDYSDMLQWRLGLEVATTGNARLKGQIWDDAEPQFNNYNYYYKVNHAHLDLKGKLLSNLGYWANPWLSAGLGVGFNRASSFSNAPTIFEAVPNANFSANTQTAFTYSLGVGLQRAINQNWFAGVGYEFSDWGKSRLGRAEGQTQNQGPSLNHLYTNGVLLSLSYVS